MQVFTILGLVDLKEDQKRAKYFFEENLKKALQDDYDLEKEEYINMFPLLVDKFGVENVKAIFTEGSRDKQEKVLKKEFSQDFIYNFEDRYFIKDEYDFYETFKILNEVIEQSDEDTIIDLTHSFRHIPILATISLISKNLKNEKSVKHIFFAKEIEWSKKYEIIDLKEYLEMANLSIMLENFEDNYTLSSNISFYSNEYQDIADDLRQISNTILSNSIKNLFESNLLNDVKTKLDNLADNKIFSAYKSSIENTKSHINELSKLNDKEDFIKLFEISNILNNKGYLLNSITLLYEAISFYCAYGIENISSNTKKHIEEYFKLEQSNIYEFTNDSRRMMYVSKKDNNPYLYNPERIGKSKSQIYNAKKKENYLDTQMNNLKREISDYLKKLDKEKFDNFKGIIKKSKKLRDNLAHANSGQSIENAKRELSSLQREFKKLCIDENILKSK